MNYELSIQTTDGRVVREVSYALANVLTTAHDSMALPNVNSVTIVKAGDRKAVE